MIDLYDVFHFLGQASEADLAQIEQVVSYRRRALGGAEQQRKRQADQYQQRMEANRTY